MIDIPTSTPISDEESTHATPTATSGSGLASLSGQSSPPLASREPTGTLSDPLGIDWAKLQGRALTPQAIDLFEAKVVQRPLREADALVLVVRRLTCHRCGTITEAQEENLFLRHKGCFTPTREDASVFKHLSRERKVLSFTSPFCYSCF